MLLRAANALSRITVMGVEMRGTIRNGILQFHVTLKSLMKIPSLRDVDWRPIAV